MQRWLAEDLASFEEFLDEAELNGLAPWDALAPAMVDALRTMKDRIDDAARLAHVVERVLVGAAGNDPKNALLWAREWLSGERLDSACAESHRRWRPWIPRPPSKLLDEVRIFPRQMEAAAAVGLVLGRNGYLLAMTWAESFYSETERSFALSGVLSGMAGRDRVRAAAEYSRVVGMMKNRHREQTLADRALSGVRWTRNTKAFSPEEIEKVKLAKPNPNLVYLESAARAIALALAREDPRNALEWGSLDGPLSGKAVAIETIYEEWSNTEPEPAFRSLLAEPERRPEAAGKLFTTWAAKNARSASAAALTLEPGPERDSAVEGVARGLDPVRSATRAGRFLGGASPGGFRSGPGSRARRFRGRLRQSGARLEAVERIANPLKRSELFQEVFPNLVEENPNLARRALSTIGLSQVEIEYFQEMLGP